MSAVPTWKFRKKTRAEIHQDPTHAEFFAPKGLAEQFVRESIQNSLDATRPDARLSDIIIRFVHEEFSKATPDQYLKELWPHLETIDKLQGQLPPKSDRISAVIIEDFATSGLEGDPQGIAESSVDSADKNRFFYFFKNIGRSGKSTGSRGRWGLGKTVFPSSSRINTFFGYTIRHSDNRRMLMGQAQLKEHSLPSKSDKYDPYGFFALHSGPDSDYVQLPVEDHAYLDRFCSDFGLQRGQEPGLSVVVAYPREELNFREVVRAAILNYYYPILSQRLVLEVIDGVSTVRLDHTSIRNPLKLIPWEADSKSTSELLPGRVELAAAAAELKTPTEILIAPVSGRKLELCKDLFAPEQLERLAESFSSGQLVSIRVPTPVERKGSPLVISHFDIFLEFDRTLRRGDDQYFNQGINISGNSGQVSAGVRGLMIVEDQPLAGLMSDSENPSHEIWQSRGVDQVSQRYERGPSTVQFVKTAIKQVANLLMSPRSTRDRELLRDIFFLQTPSDKLQENDKIRIPKKRNLDPNVDPPNPVEGPFPIGAQKSFSKTALENGFQIRGNKVFEGEIRPLRIRFAYAVFRGNAFAKFRDDDFSLRREGELSLSLSGVRESPADAVVEANVLQVTPISRDFLIEVRGFDKNRALHVEPRTIEVKVEAES